MEHANPFAQPQTLYVWTLTTPHVDELLLEWLHDHDTVYSVSVDILAQTPIISLYSDAPEGDNLLKQHISQASDQLHISLHIDGVEEVIPQDWVVQTQRAIVPQVLGDIVVLGTHHTDADAPHGKHPIWLDAGAAFGTGEHATTSGCLKALARISKHHTMRYVLDMGCGTAILGMAAARMQPCRVMVADNDPVAVKVAQENLRRNGLHGRIQAVVSQGFHRPDITVRGNYDVVIANILARPVRAMARDIYDTLQSGGYAILSGFYERDVRFVMQPYLQAGMILTKIYCDRHWATLVMHKPSRTISHVTP